MARLTRSLTVRIVALTRPRVKKHRNTARRPGRFGAGILRTLPTDRRNHTAADEAWATQWFSRSSWDDDTVLDHRAAEFHAVDRLCRGHCL
jgi:hypothetical protein